MLRAPEQVRDHHHHAHPEMSGTAQLRADQERLDLAQQQEQHGEDQIVDGSGPEPSTEASKNGSCVCAKEMWTCRVDNRPAPAGQRPT
jgi:hypothetical protein